MIMYYKKDTLQLIKKPSSIRNIQHVHQLCCTYLYLYCICTISKSFIKFGCWS